MGKLQKNGDFGKLYCAIDLHDKSMLCGTAKGKDEMQYAGFKTDEAGMRDLVEHLSEEGFGCREVWVAYEASGCGFILADVLEGEGFRVSVLAPSHLPVTQKNRSNKTDKRDVKKIMDVLRGHDLAGGDLPEVFVASSELRDHRELVRRRVRLGEELTRIKNKIHGLLKRNGFKRPSTITKNWTLAHLAWLEEIARNANFNTRFNLEGLLREMKFYQDEIRLADRELESLSQSPLYEKQVLALRTLDGVGLLTAMVFLVEIGDLRRFPNRRCLASYLGLVPRSYESGEQNDRKGHISRMGPVRVRKLLNQAAWMMVVRSAHWSVWFSERTRSGKKADRKKMIVAVMRRLSIIMWHRALDAQAA